LGVFNDVSSRIIILLIRIVWNDKPNGARLDID
jgi:hypothetical protein